MSIAKEIIKTIAIQKAKEALDKAVPTQVVEAAEEHWTAVAEDKRKLVVMTVAPQIARVAVRYIASALVSLGVVGVAAGATLGADTDLIGLVSTGVGLGLSYMVERQFAKALKEG